MASSWIPKLAPFFFLYVKQEVPGNKTKGCKTGACFNCTSSKSFEKMMKFYFLRNKYFRNIFKNVKDQEINLERSCQNQR